MSEDKQYPAPHANLLGDHDTIERVAKALNVVAGSNTPEAGHPSSGQSSVPVRDGCASGWTGWNTRTLFLFTRPTSFVIWRVPMSKRLIQDIHAGISRRDWRAVETAANRLRDDVEKTVAILAGTGVSSLPNDYPLSKLATDALAPPPETNLRVDEAPLTVSFPVHQIAHNLLLTHTGQEGGCPKIDWYRLRSEISDAIAVALDDQRKLDTPPQTNMQGID